MIPLLTGESVLSTERQHVAILVPPAVLAALGIALAVVLVHLVPDTVLGHAVRTGKLIADLVVVAGFALWFLVRALRWRYQSYTLTTHRMVLSRGVVSRVTESITLDRVQDIVVRRPLAQRLIGCGTLEIDSAGREGVEILRLVPHPQRFYTDVLQAVEGYRRNVLGYAAGAPLPPSVAHPPQPPAFPAGGL